MTTNKKAPGRANDRTPEATTQQPSAGNGYQPYFDPISEPTAKELRKAAADLLCAQEHLCSMHSASTIRAPQVQALREMATCARLLLASAELADRRNGR